MVPSPSSRGSQRRRLHGDSSQHVFQIRRRGVPILASRCARARPRRRVSTAPSSRNIESCNRPIPSKLLVLGAHRLPFATDLPLLPSLPRDNFNPHSRTFSITYRVRRKHQRLPSSLVIESAVKIPARLYLAASALPMNTNDFW